MFHGSRNPKTSETVLQLAQLLIKKIITKNIVTQENYLIQDLSNSDSTGLTTSKALNLPMIEIAALELTSIALHKSIIKFAQKIHQNGGEQIQIIPLFLAAGTHVKEDIPQEIALAETAIKNRVTLKLSPYLGKYSGIKQLLHHKFTELSGEGRILVAHGSRLAAVQKHCQSLGNKLQAAVAYWSVVPSLQEQVQAQIAAGKKSIAILPYFLFPGRIVEAIALEVKQLQQTFPEVDLIVGQPLGASEELAALIAEEI